MKINNIKEVVVIGDIHGTYNTLLALVDKIKTQFPNASIASVGDLIDRGPYSREVVKYFIDKPELFVVKANHEDMCVNDMLGNIDAEYHGEWLIYQAGATLSSYQKDGKLDRELLVEHAKWMKSLPLYIEFPDCKRESDGRYLVVSHSNVGGVWKWNDKKREQMKSHFENYIIWERDGQEDNKEIYNIVGHSPQPDGPKIKSFYANIDTGACLKRPGSTQYGILTGLHYPSMQIIQQINIEDK